MLWTTPLPPLEHDVIYGWSLHVLRAVARQDLLVEDEADGAAVAAGVDAVDADVEVLAV